MRSISGLALAAAFATAVVGVQAGSATGQTARTPDAAGAAVAALAEHPAAARAAAGQDFEVTDVVTDRDGSTHVRMDRTYRGLRVIGGDLVVHRGAEGGWEGVSQTLRAPLGVRTRPVIPGARAADKAVARSKQTRDITRMRKAGEPRLVVDATGARPRLAWEVLAGGRYADGTPSRLATYVDARSGQVIRREEGIQTVDGSGQSLYGGTVPLQLTQSGSTYQLKDPTRGGTYTTDMNNRTDSVWCQIFGFGCSAGTMFTSPDTSFGNGSTSSRESAAVDAQYGTNVTWDYFKNTHARNGIFGDGSGSFNRVHYGSNYANAFWDQSATL